jgi:hypothetical protein
VTFVDQFPDGNAGELRAILLHEVEHLPHSLALFAVGGGARRRLLSFPK